MPKQSIALTVLSSLLLAACDNAGQVVTQAVSPAAAPQAFAENPQPLARWYTPPQVSQGESLYAKHCAECHGAQGQGAPEWRKPGPDGKYPAPPLNGSGHAWHHPLKMLFHVIKNGSPGQQGNMPSWKDKLNDEEMVAIIAWFQSHWPDEQYAAWLRQDERARTGG